jgi:hypothetical protein
MIKLIQCNVHIYSHVKCSWNHTNYFFGYQGEKLTVLCSCAFHPTHFLSPYNRLVQLSKSHRKDAHFYVVLRHFMFVMLCYVIFRLI